MFVRSLMDRFFSGKSAGARRSASTPRPRSFEALETRVVLANDFFIVPGASTETVSMGFLWQAREAAFNNEIGIYQVSDDLGTINGVRPGDDNYAEVVQRSATILFASGSGAGQRVDLSFRGGQRLGFFLIQNSSLGQWRRNGDNEIGEGAIAFFSFDAANPDKIDHVQVSDVGQTGKLFSFEDLTGGGDRDFNDAQIRVDRTSNINNIPAPTVALTTATDTGTVGDLATNLTSVGITGTTVANGVVSLVGTSFTTTANSSGVYTINNIPVANGANPFTLRVGDGSGNTRDLAFTVTRQTTDLPVPTASLASASDTGTTGDNRTTLASVSLVGTTQANLSVELVGRSQTTTANSSGSFTFTNVALSLGTNTITVRIKDTFGNTKDRVLTIERDQALTDPTLSLDPLSDTGTSGDGITNAAQATLVGLSLPGLTISLVGLGRTVVADVTGKFTFADVPLAIGSNSFTVRVADDFGNTRDKTFSFTRTDTLADPTMLIERTFDSGVVGDLTTNAPEVTLVGYTKANAGVELVGLGRTTTADANGRYSFANFALANGNNAVQVKVTSGGSDVTKSFTVVRQNQAPTFAAPSGTVQLTRGLSPAPQDKVAVDVRGFFLDSDINNSLVRLATNEGNIDIELFDTLAPRTVANFLNYVQAGDYNNTIFHRSEPTFVLQAGNNSLAGAAPGATLPEIPEDPAVLNEFSASRSNLRGTVAMAKRGPATGQSPTAQTINSATNNFFVNLKDNSDNLDNQNGGFTVFGQVAPDTQETVADIASIPTQDRGSGFEDIPLKNFPTNSAFPGALTPDNLALITSATVIREVEDLTFTVLSNSNPAVTVAVDNNRLILTTATTGEVITTLEIRATDRAGASVTGTFTVRIA